MGSYENIGGLSSTLLAIIRQVDDNFQVKSKGEAWIVDMKGSDEETIGLDKIPILRKGDSIDGVANLDEGGIP